MELLAGGAPDNEYESEIEELTKAVLNSNDELEIAETIKDTFELVVSLAFNHLQ